MKPIRKNTFLLLILLVFFFAIFVFGWDYFINHKSIILKPSNGTSIKFGTQNGDTQEFSKVIKDSSKESSFRVKKGNYYVEYNGGEDYETVTEDVLVNKNLTITTPSLNYSEKKLNDVLSKERDAISNAIHKQIDGNYKITDLKLYKRGNWASAILIPVNYYLPAVNGYPAPINDKNNLDILRIILKKDGDQWKPATKTSLVFYIEDYPTIPQEIIRDTNRSLTL